MYAMTQEDYKAVRNNLYTLIAFDKEGFRVCTESHYPMHRISESAVEYTKRGFVVKIWDQETANNLPRTANRIEDYQ
jgi:hypothetical protein